MKCVFCNIVSRKEPADILYENDEVIAFYGLHFKAPVHIVVIPKKHIENVLAITEEDSRVLLQCHVAFQKLAQQFGIAETGFRIITNTGKEGQQEINHLHYHLIGGRQLIWEM